jgi:hypothetical protein
MIFSLSLRARLFGILAFLLICTFIVALAGWRTSSGAVQGLHTVFKDYVVPLRDLNVISKMYEGEIVSVAHEVRGGTKEWSDALRTVELARQTIEERWPQFVASAVTEEEKRQTTEATKLMEGVKPAIQQFQDILRRQDKSGLDDFTVNKLHQSFDPVTIMLNRLVDVQMQEAAKIYETSMKCSR